MWTLPLCPFASYGVQGQRGKEVHAASNKSKICCPLPLMKHCAWVVHLRCKQEVQLLKYLRACCACMPVRAPKGQEGALAPLGHASACPYKSCTGGSFCRFLPLWGMACQGALDLLGQEGVTNRSFFRSLTNLMHRWLFLPLFAPLGHGMPIAMRALTNLAPWLLQIEDLYEPPVH